MACRLITLLFWVLLLGCGQTKQNTTSYSTRTEITWFNTFCTLYTDEDGRAQVIKGHHKELYLIPVTISDTSKVFRLDSVKQFYKALQLLTSKHYFNTTSGDSPTFRVYRNGILLYCGYASGTDFWDVFRPIMLQIPDRYNPFIQEHGNPFADM